ncbi:MAG TPA: hypothetical protein VNL38_02955 [Candidatus Nitrosotenuis sp.]|nr:hypothetical protein [Candidatus Nitrosotenuis sp.]
MLEALKGKKTYAVGIAAMLAALGGAYFALLTPGEALTLFLSGAGMCGLRSGLTNEVARLAVERAAAAGDARRAPKPSSVQPPDGERPR